MRSGTRKKSQYNLQKKGSKFHCMFPPNFPCSNINRPYTPVASSALRPLHGGHDAKPDPQEPHRRRERHRAARETPDSRVHHARAIARDQIGCYPQPRRRLTGASGTHHARDLRTPAGCADPRAVGVPLLRCRRASAPCGPRSAHTGRRGPAATSLSLAAQPGDDCGQAACARRPGRPGACQFQSFASPNEHAEPLVHACAAYSPLLPPLLFPLSLSRSLLVSLSAFALSLSLLTTATCTIKAHMHDISDTQHYGASC
jgi:hypothetical protein